MGFRLLKKGKFRLHGNRISSTMKQLPFKDKTGLCQIFNNSCFDFNTMLLELNYCFIIVVMVIVMVSKVKQRKYTHGIMVAYMCMKRNKLKATVFSFNSKCTINYINIYV